VLAVERADVEMLTPKLRSGAQAMYQGAVGHGGAERGLRVLSAYANPMIAGVECIKNKVTIEGVAFVHAICIDREGKLAPLDVQLPFSLEVDGAGCTKDMAIGVILHATQTQAQFKGDEVEIKLSFWYSLFASAAAGMSLLTGVTMTGEPVEPMAGITVYFAEPGEKLWSIAKRYATTIEAIKKANPSITDNELPEGSRLILYRPGA
jgi:hypothetical protein